MGERMSIRVREWVQHRFLWLLTAAYALAALWPHVGDELRRLSVNGPGGAAMSLPMALLSVLLFNAGLGADVSELRSILRRPRTLVLGVVANVLVPLGFLVLLAFALRCWPDPDEAQCLLVGLAVVAAMPVAGSSTAWSQNSNGSTALSLGLVIASTLLSPLTTPLTLAAVAPLTEGSYATAVRELSSGGTGAFLLACVAAPSAAGMICRMCVGKRILVIKPGIKFANSIVLLVLCYANAAAVLPKVIAQPDWDFLLLSLGAVAGLCLAAFASGWLLARALRTSASQTRSLVFALGMSNNGTGIVLACSALAALPGAVLPVLTYNLVQHLVAGSVNRRLQRSRYEAKNAESAS
jgi:BASS family bile acid:Na+ symporter